MKRTLIAVALFTALSTSAMASDNTWKDDTKDAWIDGKAEATLLFNTKLNSFDINTDVKMGKVILTGKVDSEIEKELAEELVRGIDGVTDVDNSLTVLNTDTDDMDDMDNKSRTAMKKDMMDMKEDSRNAMNNDVKGMKGSSHAAMNENMEEMDDMDDMDDSNDGSVITDAKISTVVKSRLLFDSEVSGTDINVDVDNRVVTLKGTVKSETERQLVVSIAENTDDVDSVNDELTIKPEKK